MLPHVCEYMGCDIGRWARDSHTRRWNSHGPGRREEEMAGVLFLLPAEVDLGRFTFRSVGAIAGTYLEGGKGRR